MDFDGCGSAVEPSTLPVCLQTQQLHDRLVLPLFGGVSRCECLETAREIRKIVRRIS